MNITFQPMTLDKARKLVLWRYDPPYDVYNVVGDNVEDEARYFADPANAYYSLKTEEGDFIGFCCFGVEGQVPGGNYSADALDIGVGLRPDLTGKGNGSMVVDSILRFALLSFGPSALRVTIAVFNKRSQRVFEKAGFIPIQTFTKKGTDRQFIMMLRPRVDASTTKELTTDV